MTDDAASTDRDESSRRNWRRRRVLRAAAAAGVTGLAGCNFGGSGESGTPSASPTRTPTGTPTATDTSTATETETATERPTETEEETATEEELDVEPVAHDKLLGAHYDIKFGRQDGRRWDWVPRDVEPVLGRYRSDDRAVVDQHLRWALEHGIRWFRFGGVTGWQREVFHEHFTGRPLADLMRFSCYTRFPIRAEAYRSAGEGPGGRPVYDFDEAVNRRQLVRDFEYLERNFFSRSNYLRIDGRPVYEFYDVWWPTQVRGDWKGAIEAAKDAIGEDVYIIVSSVAFLQEPGNHLPVNLAENADVFDGVIDRPQWVYPVIERYDLSPETFADAAVDKYFEWRLVTEEFGLDYFPSVQVAQSDDAKVRYKEGYTMDRPDLPHSPDRFRRMCDAALDHIDPEVKGVIVSKFNEWPEMTAVEPTEAWGTTYLEIARDRLARGTPDYVETDGYPQVTVAFDQVPEPGDGGRQAAFRAGRLAFEEDGTTVASYNLGDLSRWPVFVEGSYPGKASDRFDSGWIRWFGGPTGRTRFFVPGDVSGATHATLVGHPEPGLNDELRADVFVDGTRTDQVDFGEPGTDPRRYTVSLEA